MYSPQPQHAAPPASGYAALPPGVPDPGVASPPRGALDYPVMFDPEPAVAGWRAAKGRTTSRVISLVISVVVWGIIWWLNSRNLWPGFWLIVGISLAVSIGWLAVSVVAAIRAKRDLRSLHEGFAVGIGREGIFLDGFLPWEQLRALRVLPERRRGGSATLVIVGVFGVWRTLPLDWLGVSPAALDGAIRALSGERFGLDLRLLDDGVPYQHAPGRLPLPVE